MEGFSRLTLSTESATPPGSSVTGNLRLHEFHSRTFRNTRLLRVWVPPGYDHPENSERHYPVFYLNDGQNLFDPATSFAHIDWQVGTSADRLIREGAIPPTIFVGIDHAGPDRLKEFLPYRSFSPMILRPRGSRYPSFLIHEVMPFMAQSYRIAKGAENASLGGSSLGGLITLYTAMVAPGIFGRTLIESPSLWVANRQVLREARRIRQWPEKVYLGIGTREAGREDKDRQTVADVRELEHMLQRSGLDERRLRVMVEEGGTHSESAWAARFPEALKFLFAG